MTFSYHALQSCSAAHPLSCPLSSAWSPLNIYIYIYIYIYLDLDSAYERKHVMSFFLNLVYFT
jgi:hypothetical protein